MRQETVLFSTVAYRSLNINKIELFLFQGSIQIFKYNHKKNDDTQENVESGGTQTSKDKIVTSFQGLESETSYKCNVSTQINGKTLVKTSVCFKTKPLKVKRKTI